MLRRGRKGFQLRRYPRIVQQTVAVFYQILVPLIIFQFVRTLFFPTTFDMFLLGVLVFIYLAQNFGWFSEK